MTNFLGLYSQSYYHPPKISLLPPPEVTRIRCLVSQDRKPRPLQRKTSFLQKITGKSGGRKEEPLRKVLRNISLRRTILSLSLSNFWKVSQKNKILNGIFNYYVLWGGQIISMVHLVGWVVWLQKPQWKILFEFLIYFETFPCCVAFTVNFMDFNNPVISESFLCRRYSTTTMTWSSSLIICLIKRKRMLKIRKHTTGRSCSTSHYNSYL